MTLTTKGHQLRRKVQVNTSIDVGEPNDRLNVEVSRLVPGHGTQYRIVATVHFGRVSNTRPKTARVEHEGTATFGCGERAARDHPSGRNRTLAHLGYVDVYGVLG